MARLIVLHDLDRLGTQRGRQRHIFIRDASYSYSPDPLTTTWNDASDANNNGPGLVLLFCDVGPTLYDSNLSSTL